MNPRHALENLVRAQTMLTAMGLRPFLVDGTLLGAVREHDFIAHDQDVDLGLFIEDYRADIPARMMQCGFEHRRTFGTPMLGLEFAFRRMHLKLDLFFYYLDATGRYHAAWQDRKPIRYGYPAFALAPLVFQGREFLAPADPEAFLMAKYGHDWRIPITKWDWAWGPKNARAWTVAA